MSTGNKSWITRRLFVQQSAVAVGALLIPAWVLLSAPVHADDGDSDGGSDSDGGGESDGGESDGGDGGDGGDSDGSDGDADSDSDGDDSDDGDEDGGKAAGARSLDQTGAARAVSQGQAIPLSSALRSVEKRFGGTVIDVSLREKGRRLEYTFKVRTERGTVRTVRMDAESGRFLGLGALFR
ncbi:PepSY domain-containing protein [Oricola sp.]|uniref:PepSY domain-containing protein n=1 Tax=Oricola sp. TaxID=1979950 RepID=UPI003BAC31D2